MLRPAGQNNKFKKLTLARPLGNLSELRTKDPFISDLAALLTGVKPVIYIDYGGADWNYIKKIAAALKLRYVFPGELHPGAGNYHLRSKRKFLLLGRSEKALAKAAAAWRESVLGLDWGSALGYPDCCVRAYLKWKMTAAPGGPDLVETEYYGTPEARAIDFRLNNVYNFFSRVTEDPRDRENYRLLNAVNTEVDLPALNIISWHPCSYGCAASLKAGREVFSFMSHYMPAYADHLKGILSKPVLFLGKYFFLTFTGQARKGRIDYKGICSPRSLMSKEQIMTAVNASVPCGTSLRLEIKKAQTLYPGFKPFLLNFADKNAE